MVNTSLYLPHGVRPDLVAEVMGILAGLEAQVVRIGNPSFNAIDVEGASVVPSPVEGLCDIRLEAPKGKRLVDGEQQHYCTFHYSSSVFGMPLANPVMSPFWIAICVGTAEFFGGLVDFNDCDDIAFNEFFQTRNFQTSDDDDFQAMVQRLRDLEPLTKADIKKYAKYGHG